ncbi:MAG TPA: endonuclease domain-containing protein, partial [Bacteroidia bacterium]|nr:endonuclease domain-containing protein [Bacteroidia bacterium]
MKSPEAGEPPRSNTIPYYLYHMKLSNAMPMYYGAKPELFEFAKRLRRAPTEAESVMWQILNTNDFRQFKFRRQHPLAKFIADFYSHQLLLVIEIDGGYHLKPEQKEYDTIRNEDMEALGIATLRFTNDEIIK